MVYTINHQVSVHPHLHAHTRVLHMTTSSTKTISAMATSTTEPTTYDISFRLFDFNIFDEKRDHNDEEDGGHGGDGGGDDEGQGRGEKKYKKDERFTTIQMFGINEKGDTCTMFVRDYQPFFYIKVGDEWTIAQKAAFISHLKNKVGKFYEKLYTGCEKTIPYFWRHPFCEEKDPSARLLQCYKAEE